LFKNNLGFILYAVASTFHLATTLDSEKAKFEIVRTDKNKYVTTNTRV